MTETNAELCAWLRANSALHPRTTEDRIDHIYWTTTGNGAAYEMEVNRKLLAWRDAEIELTRLI